MHLFEIAISYLNTYTYPLYYLALFLGASFLIQIVLEVLQGVFALFRKRIDFRKRYGEGAWALVTGGSEGIGRELACELAGQGLNIVLLARTESKLKYAQEYIRHIHPKVQVQYIVADLLKEGQKESIEEVLPELARYDFSIIVNNAGMDVLDFYSSLSTPEIINLININCFALTALTYKYCKLFKQKNKNGKKCAILNVASLAGELAIPLYHVYSGSKAFVSKLTRNLAIEMPEIDWLLLNPSEVSTAMTCFKNIDLFTITPEQCAKGTINDWGHTLATNGSMAHKIQGFIYSLLPEHIFNIVWMLAFAPGFMTQRQKFNQNLKKNMKK